jgi:CubicO group peptidase (beta-lactamase class C family)
MKTLLVALLSVCQVLADAGAEEIVRATPQEMGLSAAKLDEVTTIVQTMVDKHQTAGAVVLVARRGKVVYLESIGKMDTATGTAMRPDAIFRIYSMTKPITSVAALMLVDDGKLTLDDPVSKHLPEFEGLRVHTGKGYETVPAAREMTVRDLLRHTSGLCYPFLTDAAVDQLYRANKILDPEDTLADLVRKLGKLPLKHQPGTQCDYSCSPDVLARIVEVVGGKPFDEFLQERVFRPLDMRDTGFTVPVDKLDRFTASHRRGTEGLEVADAPQTSTYRKNPKFLTGGGGDLTGGGGLVSTARDYLRFAQMLLSGGELQGKRVLRAETVRAVTTNQVPPEALPMKVGGQPLPDMGFGLGVGVRLADKPDVAAGEYCWGGAADTAFWVAPRSELVVIVLEQLQPATSELQLALRPVIYSAIEK